MKNIFLISFLLLFAGGELAKIHINQYLAIYLHDFLVFFYLIFNLKALKEIIFNLKKINKFNEKIFLLLSINIIFAIAYSIWQNQFQFTSFLYLGRALAYFLFVLLLKKNYGQKGVVQIFLNASLLILGLGFGQYLFLPDLTNLYYLGFDDHFYRLTSTLLDPNFTALIFVFNWLYYAKKANLNKKNLWFSILFLLGLALTYSRAGYLALFLSGIYLWLKSQTAERRLIALSLTAFLILLPLLPKGSGGEGVNLQRTSSITARIISAQQYIKQNEGLAIIFGRGPYQPHYQLNREGLVSHARFSDNFLIFFYNSFGLVGTVLILILLTQEIKNKSKKKQYWQLSLLIALLTHSLFNNNLSQAFISLLFWGFYL